MKFKGEIKGRNLLDAKLKALKIKTEQGMIKAVRSSIFVVHARAVKLIQDNSGGKKAIRYSPKRTVNVSRPGSAPNTDTGRLVKSIQFDFSDGGLTGEVGTNLKYGKYLEFGTEKMKARPWLSRAVKDSRKEIAKIFRDEMQSSIRKVGGK